MKPDFVSTTKPEGRPLDGLPMPRRAMAILALSFGTALLVMDNTIATVALPTLAKALGVEPSAAVGVVSVYQLVLLMALLPLSSLGDRIGNRRLYQSGQVVFILASLLLFFVNGIQALIAVRAVQALGVAAVLSVNVGLLRRIYPASKLGAGLALSSIIIASASALAPTIGGLILTFGSWRWVFIAAAPFAVISLFMGRSLPNPPPTSTRYDLAGAAMCATMFGCLIGALEMAAQGHLGPTTYGLALVGLMVGFGFVRREARSSQPILPVELLAQARFSLPILAALLSFTGAMCFSLSLPFRLQSAYSLSPAEVGGLMAIAPLAMMATAPIAGALTDRAPKGLLSGIGMSLAASCFLLMALLPDTQPAWWRLALPMLFSGVGSGFFLAPNSHLIMSAAPRHRSATAGAMISTTRLVGSAIGATLVALLLARGLGQGPFPAFVAMTCALIAASTSLVQLLPRPKECPHASV